MNVTHDCGVQIEWQNGEKELDLKILADGTLETSSWTSGELVETLSLHQSYWRLRPLFEWLAS